MAEVRINIKAEAGQAQVAINRFAQESNKAFRMLATDSSSAFKKIETSASSTAAVLTSLKSLLLGYGALRLGTTLFKTVGDLEQGWINVAKTTGMAGKELESFQKQIRTLSTTMGGLKIETLQDIAAAAGQLGIKGADNLSEFTRVIGMMTVATDLSAETAATGFARIANIMHEPISSLETLGSIINELSNTSTATATDLVEFTQAVGGAAYNIGLTSSEVFALGATMKDMGVETGVAGTAMSQVFTKMLTNTSGFAKAAGVSTAEFTRQINEGPLVALSTLAESMKKRGMFGAAEALTELGLEGQRVGGTLLKLSGGMEKLQQNAKTSSDELQTGTSLLKEYGTAADGMFSRATTMTNALKILGEEMGKALLPASKVAFPLIAESAKATGVAVQMLLSYAPGAVLKSSEETSLAMKNLYEAIVYGEDVVKALEAGKTHPLSKMLDDVGASAKKAKADLSGLGAPDDFLAQVQEKLLESTGHLVGAYELLNIKGSGQFVEMADKAVAAFLTIKESGVASSGDIQRAYLSASEGIQNILDTLKGGNTEIKEPDTGLKWAEELEAASAKGYAAIKEFQDKRNTEWDSYWKSKQFSAGPAADISVVEERLKSLKNAFEGVKTGQTFSPVVKVEGVDSAIDKVKNLAAQLKALTDAPTVIDIKGRGSAVLPISEKIADIKTMFGSLEDLSPDLTANFSQVTSGINDAKQSLSTAVADFNAFVSNPYVGSKLSRELAGGSMDIYKDAMDLFRQFKESQTPQQTSRGGVVINVNGGSDPAATARAVRMELQKLDSRL